MRFWLKPFPFACTPLAEANGNEVLYVVFIAPLHWRRAGVRLLLLYQVIYHKTVQIIVADI
jgi:hypothetical protein